jgi:predicted DsbA family dithiol-disulfide isomerase
MNDVPYYIFNNVLKIYGSQTPEVFDDAFDECNK